MLFVLLHALVVLLPFIVVCCLFVACLFVCLLLIVGCCDFVGCLFVCLLFGVVCFVVRYFLLVVCSFVCC